MFRRHSGELGGRDGGLGTRVRAAPRGRSRALLVAGLLAALLSACQTRPGTARTPPTTQTTWHRLGTWSGRGNSQTESFEVGTGALRLTWETRGQDSAGAGRLRVSLYSAISGRPLQTIVDASGAGADTAYFEDEPRVSYLVIESQHLDWSATLDEAVVLSASPSR